MTDTPPPSAAAPASGRRWTRVLLGVSLGLNLLILGLAVGEVLGDGPGRGGRDFGLGPLSEALSHADRKALRDAFLERHPEARADRRAVRAEFEALAAALRAQPYDAAAVDTALEAIARRGIDLLNTGRDLMAERLQAMSPEDRAAFADRLEQGLKRLGDKPKAEGKD